MNENDTDRAREVRHANLENALAAENRRARRDQQREETERRVAEREAERLKTPLVERLRACGPYRAEDGMMSLAVGDYRDSHEAADEIERLQAEVDRLYKVARSAERREINNFANQHGRQR